MKLWQSVGVEENIAKFSMLFSRPFLANILVSLCQYPISTIVSRSSYLSYFQDVTKSNQSQMTSLVIFFHSTHFYFYFYGRSSFIPFIWSIHLHVLLTHWSVTFIFSPFIQKHLWSFYILILPHVHAFKYPISTASKLFLYFWHHQTLLSYNEIAEAHSYTQPW